MKFRFMSDLHLEFDDSARRQLAREGKDFARFDIPDQADDENTILILAGDCHVGHNITDYLKPQHYEYPAWLHRFKQIIYIPGNHEYYGQTVQVLDKWWKGSCKWQDNLHYCNKGEGFLVEETLTACKECKRDVKFCGCHMGPHNKKRIGLFCGTMWSDFDNGNEEAMHDARWMIADFGQIGWLENFGTEEEQRHFFGPLKALVMFEEFKERLKAFKETYKDLDVLIVATHFAPSHQMNDPRHGTQLTPYFCANMEEMMDGVDYWIYGHTHDNIEKEINGCKIVTNQRGYWPYCNTDFDPDKFIEV